LDYLDVWNDSKYYYIQIHILGIQIINQNTIHYYRRHKNNYTITKYFSTINYFTLYNYKIKNESRSILFITQCIYSDNPDTLIEIRIWVFKFTGNYIGY